MTYEPKMKVEERTVLVCDACEEILEEFCELCKKFFRVGEEIHCEGDKHYHKQCYVDKWMKETKKMTGI